MHQTKYQSGEEGSRLNYNSIKEERIKEESYVMHKRAESHRIHAKCR